MGDVKSCSSGLFAGFFRLICTGDKKLRETRAADWNLSGWLRDIMVLYLVNTDVYQNYRGDFGTGFFGGR